MGSCKCAFPSIDRALIDAKGMLANNNEKNIVQTDLLNLFHFIYNYLGSMPN
jgi:hypothetical protein